MNDLENLKKNISNPEECYYFIYRAISRSPYIEHSTGAFYTAKEYDEIDKKNPEYARDGFSRVSDLITADSWTYGEGGSQTDKFAIVAGAMLFQSDYQNLCKINVEEQLNEIMTNGIRSDDDKIRRVLVPLYALGMETSEAEALNLKTILEKRNLGYGNARYDTAVLIEIPKDKINDISVIGEGTVVPSEYIKGAYYTENQIVISYSENPNYKSYEKQSSKLDRTRRYKANSFEDNLPDEVKSILDRIMPREENNKEEPVTKAKSAFTPAVDFETDEISGVVFPANSIGRETLASVPLKKVTEAATRMDNDRISIKTSERPQEGR